MADVDIFVDFLEKAEIPWQFFLSQVYKFKEQINTLATLGML